MKKLLTAVMTVSMCASMCVNVQAKQSKTDQVFSYLKKKQYAKANRLNNALPDEYKVKGKLTAEAKRLYQAQLKKTKIMWSFYYDVTNDGKADLFALSAKNLLSIYTVKNNKIVTLVHDRFNPNLWLIASPGTKHFYVVDEMDDEYVYYYKTMYKNKKLFDLDTAKIPQNTAQKISFAPHYTI
jgi:hypothetical protein